MRICGAEQREMKEVQEDMSCSAGPEEAAAAADDDEDAAAAAEVEGPEAEADPGKARRWRVELRASLRAWQGTRQ